MFRPRPANLSRPLVASSPPSNPGANLNTPAEAVFSPAQRLGRRPPFRPAHQALAAVPASPATGRLEIHGRRAHSFTKNEKEERHGEDAEATASHRA